MGKPPMVRLWLMMKWVLAGKVSQGDESYQGSGRCGKGVKDDVLVGPTVGTERGGEVRVEEG